VEPQLDGEAHAQMTAIDKSAKSHDRNALDNMTSKKKAEENVCGDKRQAILSLNESVASEEENKLAKKRAYNRKNAARARQRAKDQLSELSQKVDAYCHENNQRRVRNEELASQIQILQEENLKLKQLLAASSTCSACNMNLPPPDNLTLRKRFHQQAFLPSAPQSDSNFASHLLSLTNRYQPVSNYQSNDFHEGHLFLGNSEQQSADASLSVRQLQLRGRDGSTALIDGNQFLAGTPQQNQFGFERSLHNLQLTHMHQLLTESEQRRSFLDVSVDPDGGQIRRGIEEREKRSLVLSLLKMNAAKQRIGER
jgi:hypothetical protein